MNKSLFFLSILVFLVTNTLFSQRSISSLKNQNGYNNIENDTLRNTGEITVTLSGKTKYTDYKIFSHDRDTTYIDTTLNIQKDYKFNYLRTDNFELLAFHNQGQTFTNLGYNFSNLSILPDIGFTAKQFSYLDIDEIKYYEVPTPTTEITYRTGLQQGQVLDAIFTANFSPRLNVSLSYKGVRSLGAYRRSLASHGNFRGAFHDRTKENQYEIRGHLTSQDFFNGKAYNTSAQGESLSSYLDELNAIKNGVDLSEIINSQFDVARTSVAALGSFESELSQNPPSTFLEAYNEVQRLVPLLKVDMVSAMSISIDFADADGD